MAKHKLYRQFERTSPLPFSLSEEISTERIVHPSTPVIEAHVRHNLVEKCAHTSGTKEKSGNKRGLANKETNLPSETLPNGDSDSDDFFDSYCAGGAKAPYTAKEDEWILKYVLKGRNIFKVGSVSLWKHLETKKENPKRTYHSMKNRFLRNIKPYIFTRFGYLISGDKEMKKILTKFPELRCKVGKKNTLSRIQLPPRNPKSEFAENGLENESRDEEEMVTSPRMSTSDDPPIDSALREPNLNMNFENFEREVTITGRTLRTIREPNLSIRVNFNSKQQLHKPVTPRAGIYEQYMKFKKQNKLIFCAACGRYNIPKKNKLADSKGDGESLNFSARRQSLTANSSVASSEGSPAKCRESDLRPSTPFSPNLLRDARELHDSPVGWGTQERPLTTGEVGRAPEMPSSIASSQGAGSSATYRLREADDDLDSTYHDVVADFKKLIKNEEELMLVKKCLHGKGAILGLSDSTLHMNMESYFVDLSPNLETPALTVDYSSRPNGVSEGSKSCSLLARNMMKMLE